jgi:formate dehydrogenase subunit gamma
VQSASTDIAGRTASVISEHRSLEGPLLPILHGLQQEFGYVPAESLPIVASALNLSRAEVYGVFSFYHDFRDAPAGRHDLKLCQAEACQSMGSAAVAQKLKQKLGIDFHETKNDGSVTLEPVYCLGLCACAPSAMLDGQVIGRVGDDEIDDILEVIRT